jgi:hypothetical protein
MTGKIYLFCKTFIVLAAMSFFFWGCETTPARYDGTPQARESRVRMEPVQPRDQAGEFGTFKEWRAPGAGGWEKP